MDWFRMYSEFSHDPKVQSMPEVMQRRLVMLLCLRCSNALVTLHVTEVAFALRISNEDMAETKALFVQKGFIDDAWEILNWSKRQFVSDSSAARVSRHRAAKKEGHLTAVIADETVCNVTVTPQNRTDTEQKKRLMSGKPDAIEVLTYLNHKAKRDYRAVDSNLKLIAARLVEGATVAECKAVVDMKVAEWSSDPKMSEYLRPETLFNAMKFGGYIGKLKPQLATSGGAVDSRFRGAK